jgi:hypothetical protein
LDEQLNYEKSNVTWYHPEDTLLLFVTYNLRGATPNRQYQVGVHIFDHCHDTFGRFPDLGGCGTDTREGVTKLVQGIEFGVAS